MSAFPIALRMAQPPTTQGHLVQLGGEVDIDGRHRHVTGDMLINECG